MNWHSLVITKWPFSTIAFTDQIIVVLRDKGGTGSDHICRCCYSYMIDPVDKGPRKKKSNNCITVRRLDKGCEKWDFPHLTQHTTGGAFFFKASKTKTNTACTVSLQRKKKQTQLFSKSTRQSLKALTGRRFYLFWMRAITCEYVFPKMLSPFTFTSRSPE